MTLRQIRIDNLVDFGEVLGTYGKDAPPAICAALRDRMVARLATASNTRDKILKSDEKKAFEIGLGIAAARKAGHIDADALNCMEEVNFPIASKEATNPANYNTAAFLRI